MSDVMKTSEVDVLFVYGTLRRGCRNHKVLRKSHGRFLAEGQIGGTLFDMGEFPGATRDGRTAARVWGEVYSLPNPGRALKLLDKLEAFDADSPESSLFLREITTVTLADGRRVQAWIYWLRELRGKRRRLASGEYRPSGD
jgi:gamma-glutamylcyclotransferase (GGCT)/AIG2-like uncharacterized protein YtfP